ncbi:MAG: helix-turn-helix domain-containing protein [Chloroflexota bacterium]|nr:helix-turn-helix domain-containing protein [Chloroflexota bacterium]
MARVAAVLPGYATVAHSSGVLHLAPRSVRDLIYSGRLPSLRIARLHYVRAADLESERRRRLGLRLPSRKPRARRTPTTPTVIRPRPRTDPALRRARAAERSALVTRWAERHHLTPPELPFAGSVAAEPTACASCGRAIRAGGRVVRPVQDETQLCLTCGRRVLLDWADHRRLEAAAARRMAHDLGATAEPNAHASRVA